MKVMSPIVHVGNFNKNDNFMRRMILIIQFISKSNKYT